jgi:hypothetical protein
MSGSGTGTAVTTPPYETTALTRAQIKTAVDSNTGRGTEKASLIETLCDEALKLALSRHPFRDAQTRLDAVAITEDATSVDFSAVLTGTLIHIVTARICETAGTTNWLLHMKGPSWWDQNVVEASDNLKGQPRFGLRYGNTVLFERPCESNLSLKLVVTQEKRFTNDATVCSVALLDTFVVQYVTAFVFKSVEQDDKFAVWHALALGPQWANGTIGGTLRHAIDTDKFDLSEEMIVEPPSAAGVSGISVMNLDSAHDDYGATRSWY